MTAILFIELSEPTKANGDKQRVNAISAMHEDYNPHSTCGALDFAFKFREG